MQGQFTKEDEHLLMQRLNNETHAVSHNFYPQNWYFAWDADNCLFGIQNQTCTFLRIQGDCFYCNHNEHCNDVVFIIRISSKANFKKNKSIADLIIISNYNFERDGFVFKPTFHKAYGGMLTYFRLKSI